MSVAVFSFQAALVSSQMAGAQGLSISADRISLHLGKVKSASRPGTATAALLAMRDVPVPRHGLRASLMGIQLRTSTAWQPMASRQDADAGNGLKVRPVWSILALPVPFCTKSIEGYISFKWASAVDQVISLQERQSHTMPQCLALFWNQLLSRNTCAGRLQAV